MEKYGQAALVVGVINTITYDTNGLESSEAETKHCDEILVNVTGHVGNKFRVQLERETLFEIHDYLLDTGEESAANVHGRSVVKLNTIPIDRDVPEGKKLQVGIVCGGTAKTVYATYVYHLV